MDRDKERIAQRLAYLWDMRDKNTKEYIRNGYGEEKEDIYMRYGHDNQIMLRAKEIYRTL